MKYSKMRRLLISFTLALGISSPLITAHADQVVTIYSADGLKDGSPNWFGTLFDDFTKQTGIKVQYVEAGSGVVVNRVLAEKANPQADVLVTLPPFIQKAASMGLLQPMHPAAEKAIPADTRAGNGMWFPLVNNYACWIYNSEKLSQAPQSYSALIDSTFKNRLQYSTPGQAGDGTAVMLMAFHLLGTEDKGFDFLKKLQVNNVGPSASTGRLAGLVNKGELLVANGDVQMNFAQMRADKNMRIFFPQAPDGKRYTLSLPYDIGLVKGAPNSEAGRKLIDFLLSKEAQEQVSGLAGGFPVRTDVKASGDNAIALNKLMQGVVVWNPNWNDVAKNLDGNVARWHQITGS